MECLAEVVAPKHCSTCIQVFDSKQEYEKHQAEVHRKGIHSCNYCYKIYGSKNNLKTHIKNAHDPKNKGRKCLHCEKFFESAQSLDFHVKNAHIEKLYSCGQCDEKFVLRGNRDSHHRRKHLKTKNVPCPQCDKLFCEPSDVKKHIVQVHSDYRPYQCDMCPAKFKRNSGWRTHRKSHLSAKNFECPICHKRFKHRRALEYCLTKHAEPLGPKFPCSLCGAVLNTKHGRKAHMNNVHNNTNRPACPICTKTLVDNSNLKRHLRDVHGNQEKNFECSICSLKWTKTYQLNNHMKIHSGQVFKCTFDGCESKSNTQYGLNYHIKKKHGRVSHRKPLEELEKDWNKKFTCDICEKSFKLGKAPLHAVRAHRKIHEKQEFVDCIIEACTKKIILVKNKTFEHSCNLPMAFYKHLEETHAIDLDKYHVQVTFSCKYCQESLILGNKRPAENLKSHLQSKHPECLDTELKGQKATIPWNKYFERNQITLEKVEPPSFIDQLLSEKKCMMRCDFQVTDEKRPSAFKPKLLKHYSLEHFGPHLLEKEEIYFRGKHFPICVQCAFEIGKNGAEKMNAKALHIGVSHNEIVPILTSYFKKENTAQLGGPNDNC